MEFVEWRGICVFDHGARYQGRMGNVMKRRRGRVVRKPRGTRSRKAINQGTIANVVECGKDELRPGCNSVDFARRRCESGKTDVSICG